MYVAALAHPLSVEYVLLDPEQYFAAKDYAGGLFAFVERVPALKDGARRFRSIAALRKYCHENGVDIAGDLHGCLGEAGPARGGSGLL